MVPQLHSNTPLITHTKYQSMIIVQLFCFYIALMILYYFTPTPRTKT